MQFFVCSLVVGGLTFVSDLRRVVVLLNTVLMLYVPQIRLSFSDSPLLYGRDTVVIGLSRGCWEASLGLCVTKLVGYPFLLKVLVRRDISVFLVPSSPLMLVARAWRHLTIKKGIVWIVEVSWGGDQDRPLWQVRSERARSELRTPFTSAGSAVPQKTEIPAMHLGR